MQNRTVNSLKRIIILSDIAVVTPIDSKESGATIYLLTANFIEPGVVSCFNKAVLGLQPQGERNVRIAAAASITKIIFLVIILLLHDNVY